jgi:DNA-binding MarR family transcriptional regulator
MATDPSELIAAGVALVRSIEGLRAHIAAKEQIAPTEMRALARISEAGELTPKHLANGLGLTTGAVTAVADRLVAGGLLARGAHPTDRRSLLLELTPDGQEVIDRISASFSDAMAGASRGATDKQIQETVRVILDTVDRIEEITGA